MADLSSIRRDSHQLTVQESQNVSIGLLGAVTATTSGGVYAGLYYGVQAISDCTFTTLRETGILTNGMKFDTGAEEISVGDLIGFDGETHQATVMGIYNETGTWAGGDRAGILHLEFSTDSPETDIAAATDINILNKNTRAVLTASAAATVSEATGDTGNDLNGETLKAGSVIYGLFSEIDLSAGTARLYKA